MLPFNIELFLYCCLTLFGHNLQRMVSIRKTKYVFNPVVLGNKVSGHMEISLNGNLAVDLDRDVDEINIQALVANVENEVAVG